MVIVAGLLLVGMGVFLAMLDEVIFVAGLLPVF